MKHENLPPEQRACRENTPAEVYGVMDAEFRRGQLHGIRVTMNSGTAFFRATEAPGTFIYKKEE